MSEPSFIDAAMQPGDGVLEQVGQRLQTATSITAELGTIWAQRSAEKARAIQAEAEAAERANRDRIKALRDGDMPLMRQVWDERWWNRVAAEDAGEAGLAEIGMAWETAGGWARNGDPMGRRTQNRLRELIKDRFGVELGDEPVTGTLVSEILASLDAERSVSFVIRDSQNDVVVDRGSLRLDAEDRRPLRVVAADRLSEFSRGRDDETEPAGRYVIDVYDADRPGGERQQTVRDNQAAQTRQEYDQWARDVLAGTQEAPLAAVRDVHLVERQRLRRELQQLRQDDPRVAAAREALAEETALRQGADPRMARPTTPGDRLTAEQHAARMAELRDQIADMQLRIDTINADLLGEDAALVTEAAVLRGDLDPDWWNTASPEEVAGVWTHVDQWTDGAAKADMRADLQEQILSHYGIDVGPEASFERVSGEIQRSRAERRGERLLRFRVDGPGEATATADTFTVSAARFEASGTESVSRDESVAAFAERTLTAIAGDLEIARERRLTISVTDHSGAPLGTFDASGPADDRKGADERVDERRSDRPRTADADAEHDDQAAVAGEGAVSVPPADRPRGEAAGDRANADRDLLDADALQHIVDSDPGAEESVRAATKSRKAWPKHEPPASGGVRRSRRKKQGLGRRGEQSPRSWQHMHGPKGTGRGD